MRRRAAPIGARGVFVAQKDEPEPWHPERDGFPLRVLSFCKGEPFPYAVEFEVDGFRTIAAPENVAVTVADRMKRGGH